MYQKTDPSSAKYKKRTDYVLKGETITDQLNEDFRYLMLNILQYHNIELSQEQNS